MGAMKMETTQLDESKTEASMIVTSEETTREAPQAIELTTLRQENAGLLHRIEEIEFRLTMLRAASRILAQHHGG